MKRTIILFICLLFITIPVKADLTSTQEQSIKTYTTNLIETGLNIKDKNGYPLFAYMQGQARIDGWNEKLYYISSDYNHINKVNANKWTFDCASFVSYVYKHVFGLALSSSKTKQIDSYSGLPILSSTANPYLVSDFVSDADSSTRFYYIQKNVTASTINFSVMKPGDLIIIKGSHIMLYLGDGKIGHASASNITKNKTLGIAIDNLKTKYPDKTFYVIRVKDNIINPSITGNTKITWPSGVNVNIPSDNNPEISTSLSTTSYVKNLTLTVNLKDDNGVVAYYIGTSNTPVYTGINSVTNTNITYDVSSNGTIYIYAKDGSGNVSNTSVNITNIDKEGPIISSFYYENGYIIVNASDNKSGLDTNAYAFNNGTYQNSNKCPITINGNYTVSVRDKLGNVSSRSLTVTQIIDNKPVINSTLSTTSYTKNLVLNVSFTDDGGIVSYYIGTDNVPTYQNITSSKNYSKDYNVSSNGTIYIYAKDNKGNVSNTSVNITNIDKEGPTISSFYYENGYIIVNASDNKSGLDTNAYAFNNNTYQSSNKYSVTINGNYTVSVRDKLGNVSSRSLTVTQIIDNKPVINPTLSTTSYTKSLVLNVSFTDDGGIVSYYIGTDNVPTYQNITSSKNYSKDYNVSSNGTIYIYAKDNKGNVSNTSVNITNIDKTGPTISKFYYENGYIIVNATDSGSGLSSNAYSFGGGSYQSSNKYSVTKNGTYTVKVCDKLGNTSEKILSVTEIIDNKPVINTSLSTEDFTKQLTLSINITDDNGIVAYYIGKSSTPSYKSISKIKSYDDTYEVSSNGVLYIFAKDDNGNVTKKTVLISNIDNTGPNISGFYYNSGYIIVNCNDNESGLNSSPYSFNNGAYQSSNQYKITENGTYTVKVRDKLGNITSKSLIVTEIVDNKPIIKSTLSTNEFTKKLTLNVNFSDDNGVVAYYIGKKNTPTYTTVSSTKSIDKTYEVTENGLVYLYVKDNKGNITNSSITISNIDNNKPNIVSLYYENGYIVVIANDNESGLADNAYSFNGGSYQKSNKYAVSKNGIYQVNVKDKLGNILETSLTVSEIKPVVDNSPIIETSLSTMEYTKKVIITVDLTDDNGISSYYIGSSSTPNYQNITLTKTYQKKYEVTNNGNVYIFVKDNKGNISDRSLVINNIDNTGPTISNFYYENGYIIVNASDDKSGLADLAYSFNNENYQESNHYMIDDNGNYSVKVKDKLGNITEKSLNVSSIPDDNPSIITKLSTYSYAKKITLTVDFSDDRGIVAYYIGENDSPNYIKVDSKLSFSKNYDISKNGMIYIYAKDTKGKITKSNINIHNIDNLGPNITNFYYENGYIIVNAIDSESGLDELAYSFNDEEFQRDNKFSITENGIYKVKVRDKLGNVSDKNLTVTEIIKIIDYSPVIKEKLSTYSYTKKATLTVDFTDDNGISAYYIGKEIYPDYVNVNNSKNVTKTYDILENGSIYIFVKDNKGNITSKTLHINNIDNLGPNITSLYYDNGYLIVNAVDSEIGLNESGYSFNNSSYQSSNKFLIKENGIYTVKVRDKLGNITEKEIQISDIKTTENIPTIKTNLSSVSYTKKVILNVEINDNSGVTSYYIGTSNNPTYTSVEMSTSVKKSIVIETNETIYIYAKNKDNKVSSKMIYIGNIDNISPSILEIKYENGYIVVLASDKESGLDSKAYSFNGSEYQSSNKFLVNKNGVYSVVVRDKVGNISKGDINVSEYNNNKISIIDCYQNDDMITIVSESDKKIDAYYYNSIEEIPVDALWYHSISNEFSFKLLDGKNYVWVKDIDGNISSPYLIDNKTFFSKFTENSNNYIYIGIILLIISFIIIILSLKRNKKNLFN